MTPTEKRILAAEKQRITGHEIDCHCCWCVLVEVGQTFDESARNFNEAADIFDRSFADAAAKKRRGKWKQETPSPYDLSERGKK